MSKGDFIDFLLAEFEDRKASNASYSLRAYARDLGLQSGTLSHLLKRKRPLSNQLQKQLFDILQLTPEQISAFSTDTIKRFDDLAFEIFTETCDWICDAILELTRVKGFESTTAAVVKQLGVSEDDAQIAVDKLMRYRLLVENINGRWSDKSGDNVVYGGEETNDYLKSLQIQLLEKAIEAIENVTKAHREQASMTLAVNSEDLPEVRKRIKAFTQELCEFVQRPNRQADSVYQLLVSYYPLTRQVPRAEDPDSV